MEVYMNQQGIIFILIGLFSLTACTRGQTKKTDRSVQDQARIQVEIESISNMFIQQYGLDDEQARQIATQYVSAPNQTEKNRIFMEATGGDNKQAQEFNITASNIDLSDNKINMATQNIMIRNILEGDNKKAKQALIQDNCVVNKDQIAQGYNTNLYGKACLDGKYLEIKTSTTGKLIPSFSSFSVNNANGDQGVQENVDFLTTSYEVEYSILENKGDAPDYPLLLKFLKEGERFVGSKETNYRIIFKIFKDYLVLYKASKNKDDFPQNERIKGYADSGLQKEGDYYMIPFIGYPISFCAVEPIRDNATNKLTNTNKVTCDNISLENSEKISYVQLDTTKKQVFKPIDKTDWFRSDYFDGKWYYIASSIKSKVEGELHSDTAKLVEFEPEQNFLNIKDVSIIDVIEGSGTIYQQSFTQLPVKWKNFELDLDGKKFNRFAEREYNPDRDHLNKPYVEIDFENLSNIKNITFSGLSNLIINDEFFSFIQTGIDKKTQTEVQIKFAFLKQSALDTKGFKPRRWFIDDHEKLFGIMPAIPLTVAELAQNTLDERTKYFRMSKFNTSLNTDEEKANKTKVIKWYYSKNSTTDPEYRAVAQKAIDIYNKAFEKIMRETCPEEIKSNNNGEDCPKVQVQLVSDEPKDLGDIRYNIINFIETLPDTTGVIGKAPSFVDPTTGQMIGATSNVLIHAYKEGFTHLVRAYIRYEIFQKDIRAPKENETHVIAPYLRAKIENSCSEVTKLISSFNTNTPQNTNLQDREVIISCAEKLSKQTILNLVLHELGHNFGMAHNFRCSMDPDNFYINHAEMIAYFGEDLVDTSEPLSKSSCVMDYLPVSHPQLNVLGKYDLATLKFLYTDQAEVLVKAEENDFKETTINLQLDDDPLKQSSLSQKNENSSAKYLTCSDWKTNLLTCIKYDYGKDPEEVVKNEFLNIKRIFNNRRYRYDTAPNNFFVLKMSALFNIVTLHYGKWLKLKNDLLDTKGNPSYGLYELGNKEAITQYTRTLDQHYLEDTTEKEYKMYYPVKSVFKQKIMDWILIEEMSCQVQFGNPDDGETTKWFTLEFLNSQIQRKTDLYVENCFSPSIQKFLETHYQNVKVIAQKGYENFKLLSYYSNLDHPDYKVDIINLDNLYINFHGLGFIIYQLSQEPDIIHELEDKTMKELLNRDTFQSQFKATLVTSLLSAIYMSLSETLISNNRISEKYEQNFKTYSVANFNFYEKIQEPTEKEGINIIPFVQEVYDNYTSIERDQSFQDFFIEQKEVINWQKRLYWPHQSDSFTAKLFKNLNKNIEDLNKIRQKQNLNLMESYEKQTLEIEQKYLTQYARIPH